MLSILAVLLVFGIVSFINLPKEQMPDISAPFVFVTVILEGVSPEDGERILVRPLETEFRTLEGLKEMRAIATEGMVSMFLEFFPEHDADLAQQQVREKVDMAKSKFPQDTLEPIIRQLNPSEFPVLQVTVSGDVPERILVTLARRLQDQIETNSGVLEASLSGAREEVLEILIEPAKLESYGISDVELFNAISRNNRLVTAGAMDTGLGRFSVKVPGLLETHEDLMTLPIRATTEGVVTLSDVASVQRTFKDATSFARVDGKRAIVVEVRKRIGYNVIEMNAEIRTLVEEEVSSWPEAVRVSFSNDQSINITNAVTSLQTSITNAIVLVMIIVVAALGLRSAALVGIAIPASFLIGFVFLGLFGLTLNNIVLFGLMLSVGMLVDGAIVVVEYADRRMIEGATPKEAYAAAAKRMAWPIISSTATTLAAFVPMIFWPGMMGRMMRYMPITLIIVLVASLALALIFVPTLGSLFGRPSSISAKNRKALQDAEDGDLDAVPGATGVYIRVVKKMTRHPGKVLSGAVLFLVLVTSYYAVNGNGVVFMPEVEPERASVSIHARGNLSALEIDALVQEIEQAAIGVEGVKSIYATSNVPSRSMGNRGTTGEDIIGRLNIEFEDWRTRRPATETLQEIRDRAAAFAGISVSISQQQMGPPLGADLEIEIRSQLPEKIGPVVDALRQFMDNEMDGFVNVDDSRPLPGIEWQLEVDRAQAGIYGADVTTVGTMVQLVTSGLKVGAIRPDDSDEEVDIRLRYPFDSRNVAQIDQLRIMTNQGLMPISNFVTRKAQPRVGAVERVDGFRSVTITAEVAFGVNVDQRVQEIRAWIAEHDQEIDDSVEITFGGADEQQQESGAFMINAMAISLFMMAIILVTQFNSFYHAFLILSTVILSTTGVTLGLIISGQPAAVLMTGIGVLALSGIVVNNNIVLIDTYHELLRKGFEPMEAIWRTGAKRLRPVLLTTVTTVVGLAPMTIQLSIDFISRTIEIGSPHTAYWAPLSTAIVSGLSFATLLTLIVTPCALALPIRMREGRERRRGRRLAKSQQGVAAE